MAEAAPIAVDLDIGAFARERTLRLALYFGPNSREAFGCRGVPGRSMRSSTSGFHYLPLLCFRAGARSSQSSADRWRHTMK